MYAFIYINTHLLYVYPTISIITLNTDGLNASIKRHCQDESKNKTQLYDICKKPTLTIMTHMMKNKWRKIYHANSWSTCLVALKKQTKQGEKNWV